MDYFSHGFWSYIFFNRIKRPIYAVLFGLIPDTMSWFIYAVYRFVTGGFQMVKPHMEVIDNWVFTLYGISHSLVVWALVILAIYLVMKRVPAFVYAAPVAILMDIPTHTREFLPTPFLWPISDWKFPGFSWGTPIAMIINYSLIVLLITYIIFKKKKIIK